VAAQSHRLGVGVEAVDKVLCRLGTNVEPLPDLRERQGSSLGDDPVHPHRRSRSWDTGGGGIAGSLEAGTSSSGFVSVNSSRRFFPNSKLNITEIQGCQMVRVKKSQMDDEKEPKKSQIFPRQFKDITLHFSLFLAFLVTNILELKQKIYKLFFLP
jgi:hypothetical protein